MKKQLLAVLASLVLIASGFGAPAAQAQQVVRQGSQFFAQNYGRWSMTTFTGTTATGAATLTMLYGYVTLPDGRPFVPFNTQTPLSVDVGTNRETVTPSSVSGCFPLNPNQGVCQVTATFSNVHGAGTLVTSGDGGLQEAISDAVANGGGLVVVDLPSVTDAQIIAAVPFPNVAILDVRNGTPQYWNIQGGATVLATPTTLTAVTALPSATPVGAFGTGTYHMCIAYVDIMGQEGNCSADFSQAGLATGSFIFSAPAASTGAVGYTIYIGLTAGGVTNLDYKVPLVTQPTVIGAYPAANGVCTLTTLETITPACAVTNATYGQTGATATVTAITLNTSQINPETTIISTTSIYVPNPGGRTTASYVAGSHIGTSGAISSELAFPITAAAATGVPAVLGTINVRPGYMNQVGKVLEVCGTAYGAGATTATIVNIQFQWDANGSNTAGAGVKIGDLNLTMTGGLHYSFCEDFQTTVASASATGGSIFHANAPFLAASAATQGVSGAGTDILTAAIGSLNLADSARINVIYLHVTGTDGAGVTLQSLTAKLI